MIEILESTNWTEIRLDGKLVYNNHRPNTNDWVKILRLIMDNEDVVYLYGFFNKDTGDFYRHEIRDY